MRSGLQSKRKVPEPKRTAGLELPRAKRKPKSPAIAINRHCERTRSNAVDGERQSAWAPPHPPNFRSLDCFALARNDGKRRLWFPIRVQARGSPNQRTARLPARKKARQEPRSPILPDAELEREASLRRALSPAMGEIRKLHNPKLQFPAPPQTKSFVQ